MKKAFGVVLVLAFAGALFLVPSPAAACKSCSVLSFWDPNCSHSGCTYCEACSICCGGDPGAGGNCSTFCGGALLASTERNFSPLLADSSATDDVPSLLTTATTADCSPAK